MRVVTAEQAVGYIRDGSNVTVGGFGHCGVPEALLAALEKRYLDVKSPNQLTLVVASAAGDKNSQGLNRLAHEGFLKRVIGGFWSLAPRIGKLISENKVEGHNWPQGVISHMFRAIASGRPGVITEVGIGTFIDPSQEGGRLNSMTVETLIEPVQIGNRPSLYYKAVPLHCALLRGTRSDENGNITMEREASLQDSLAQAQAVHNSGGVVIVQVMQIAAAGSIAPNLIQIPGILVDYVVVAESQEHMQTYGEQYNPAFSGEWLRGMKATSNQYEESPTPRTIIARRALLELLKVAKSQYRERPMIINLGIGTPEEIARQISIYQTYARSRLDFTLTVESGAIGGTPASGMSFGATAFPEAIIKQAELFDLYDGGGIDIAFLGFGQIDKLGRVNVASLGNQLNGVGGFVNISQAAKQIVFCGSFTAGGLRIELVDQKVCVVNEGSTIKYVEQVSKICYDPAGRASCRSPLIITERAVLRLTRLGLEIIEIAPGISLENDVLALAQFPLSVSENISLMPTSVFSDAPLEISYQN